VMSLTVTAGIGLSLVQSPRVIELSTTCNLSVFLVKPFLEIQGLDAFSTTLKSWSLKTKIRFLRMLYSGKCLQGFERRNDLGKRCLGIAK
jgi:hypothetical protein